MVLEAAMILVDNSESSRNGDYQPTRFDSQSDAVGILFQSITQGNPESSVGLMSIGGKEPEVLVTLTTDQGKILDGLHRTKKNIGGHSHLMTGIQVATLALKHRQNRSQRQRIIAFVCSPVEDDEKQLTKLAQKTRKANICVDFILFGDLEDDVTRRKLTAFNDVVKTSDSSHFVLIPASSKLLSDQLISSPIMLGEGAGGPGGAGGLGGNEDFEFGIDQDLEPDLALALRMSLEEENARQEKRARELEQAAGKTALDSVEEENQSGEGGSKGDKKDDDKKDHDKKDDDKMDTS